MKEQRIVSLGIKATCLGELMYLLIVEDRHQDVEIYCYSTYDLTFKNYNKYKEKYLKDTSDYTEDAGPDMNYFLKYYCYSQEGDCIYIIKVELDENIE